MLRVLAAALVAAAMGGEPPTAVGLWLDLPDRFPPERGEDMQRRIVAGLSRSGLTVDALPPQADGSECRERACFQNAAEQSGAEYLVSARVAVRLRDYQFSMTLVDGKTGTEIGTVGEQCSPCGFEEATDLAENLATQLRRRLDVRLGAKAQVRIQSQPTGAAVRVDDRSVGAAPVSVYVEPGPHEASAELPPARRTTLKFEAVAGVAETLVLKLPPPPADDGVRPRRHARALGWSLIGVGAALSVVGIAFIAIDGQPVRNRCSGSDVDVDGNCRRLYNSLPYGIASLVGGSGLVAAGVGLLVARRRKLRRRRR